MEYFSITSDSKLAHRGKKGLITYIHKNGTWRKTKTSDETNAKILQRKWDNKIFHSSNGTLNPETTWGDWKEEYITFYKAVNRAITTYGLKRTIKTFEEVVFGGEGRGDLRKLHSISEADCELWMARRLREVRPQSFANELSHMSLMFEKARKRKYLDSNPLDEAPRPKATLVLEQKVLRVDEADACLAWIDKDEPRYSILGQLAYETGMRRDELIHVKVEDVNFASGYLMLTQHSEKCQCAQCAKQDEPGWLGKAGVPRKIPLTPDMCSRLLKVYQGQKTGVILPVTAHSVSIMFRRAFDRAGVKGGAHTHTFRHTMATDMERAGVRRSVIKRMLGHAASSTTDQYTLHVTEEELKDALKKTMEWRNSQRISVKTTQIDGVDILEQSA